LERRSSSWTGTRTSAPSSRGEAWPTFAVITAIGEFQEDLTGLKEIIRFKYTFDGGDAWSAAVHFFMQAPSWRPF
jgi:hypothetical protein